MTEEEARQLIVTSQQALEEIERHGLDIQDFLEDVDPECNRTSFTGSEVLNWLGY